MNAIEVKNLVKNYKNFQAVKGIDFSVKEGELFAFLGENGAGKSTTINMLCTILSKTSGDVKICGHELGKEDDRIREKIGVVFQTSVLDPKLTVKDNLYTRGSYYGLSKKEIAARINEFDESLHIGDILNRRFDKLSGGQKRRVDIVRALIHRPEILFLDEPTTGLDPKTRKEVWDYIMELKNKRHMTIFLTTHYMEETDIADRVVILDHGKILCDDTPAGLKTRYSSRRLLWYTPKNKINDEVMASFADAEKVTYEGDRYIATLKGDALKFLNDNRDKVTDYELLKGSMDDVFLNLTGRELA
ncbi:MAG: ABC transporter ATP-binding protein [Lachnospiraceae bacterium]|nr:ABC transporter ATP-binding protein [Lachnospiraceae bacterium]